jgi:PAS domain S-box-containing protein
LQDVTERKQIEDALVKSKKELQQTLDATTDGIWTWNFKTDELFFSPKYYTMLGYSPDAFPASYESWVNLLHPSDREKAIDVADKYLKTKPDIYENEFRMRTQNGDYRWLRAHAQIVERDQGGEAVYMIGNHEDITERRLAEESLKESEIIFSTIFENNPAAIAMTCIDDGRLVNVNLAWQDTTEYSRSEVIGHTPFELNLWVNNEQRDRLIEKVRDHGKARGEIQIRRKSGEIRDLLLSAILVEVKGQNYLLTMAQDISERKRAEQAFRVSNERFLTVLDSIDATIYVADIETYEILFMNRQMVKDFGRDMTGEICWDVFRGESGPCDYCTNCKLIDKHGKPTGVYSWHDRNPITGKWYINYDRAIEWDNGRMVRLQIATDITEIKEMEEKLRHSQKIEAIGTLAGGIAHDFNNILASIIGFTELALDESQKGTVLEDSLQEVYSAGKRAKDLVKQILAFARQSDEQRGPIQPRKLAKEVLQFIRSTIPATIEIRQDINSDSWILGNATQVHQVLMNLCANAAHAMEDSGGVLKVSLKDVVLDKKDLTGMRQGDYIEIVVSDTGVGIAPDKIESIFDPYFTTKDPGEGTGMGLAVVHGIVESYGGKISVDSQLGKGATFRIYLPITRKRSVTHEYVPEQLPSGTERILFVDDEAPIAKMGSQILERLGYSVTTLTSSIEALELFQAKPDDFDLVVTDMTMPNMTGDKLAVELMKIRSDIPVILCTGYSKKISDEIAAEIGIKAFAYKPVVKADLAKIVRKVLDEAKS